MTALGNQLARQEAEEISRGIRILLATPLLLSETDRESFELVRRRRAQLERWFDYHCGWRLLVEPRQGYARLVKVRSHPDATRPARRHRSGRAPFDRRRYTLWCSLAAELLSAPVTTIGLLADRVVQATANEPSVSTFDTARHHERSAFVDALKMLERQGVVVAVDGTTESYLEHEDAKVLYHTNPTLLLRLVAAPTPPSRVADEFPDTESHSGEDPVAVLDRLLVEPRYGSASDSATEAPDVQRNLWLRHSLMRRLLDEPVVYRDALSQPQRTYIDSLTGRRLVRQAAEQAGFALEERAEGFLLVDPDAIATDDKFPDDRSNAKVAALILLDHLVAAGAPLERGDLVARAEALLASAPTWARAYQSEDGAARLADDGVRVLCAFGLARADDAAVRGLPAAARYTVQRPATEAGANCPGADHD